MKSNKDVGSLLHFFSTLHIDINESWLKDAVAYIDSQKLNINFEQYKNLVFDQLLYSNLCDSLSIKKIFNWNNDKYYHREKINLFVQVKTIYDVSRSALEQFLEMSINNCVSIGDFDLQSNNTESNASNKETKSSARRMLMLKVTDGKNDFTAIESTHIPFLSAYLKPGIKLYISGECEIANGVIHLKKENCQVIGGAVKAYLSQNTLDKVLAGLLPKLNISSKDRKQAKKYCREKMKEVDNALSNNSINNLQQLSNSLDYTYKKEEENTIPNKENTSNDVPKAEISLTSSSINRFDGNNVSTLQKKTPHTSNKPLNIVTSNVKSNSTLKDKNLTVPEIFDYFFKLHIFLNNDWISSNLQKVSNKYSDTKSQMKYIYQLFLECGISKCLISSSPEFKKGFQEIESHLIMEIESISLRKDDNIKVENGNSQCKFVYKLSDGNKYFDAIIREPITCNTCNHGHLLPGFKLLIHGKLEVNDSNNLLLNGSNCKLLDETFSLPDINVSETKPKTPVNKPQTYILIDSDDEYIVEDDIPSKKQKLW
uniref:RecQ-mediated genome instability protein 1 n=1 Tax=Strongyloides papillosus TaxID=174720 RepID=A0A0N5B2H6_STREA